MYETFLERNTDCIRQTVDDAFIAQYADIAPESLTTLWKEVGLGIFCNGLFRIINPEEFQDFADEYNSDSFNKTVLPFMATAFGHIRLCESFHYRGLRHLYKCKIRNIQKLGQQHCTTSQ